MLPNEYADHVDAVTCTDGHKAADLAHTVAIDPSEGYADIEAAIAQLEITVSNAGKKRKPVAPSAEDDAKTAAAETAAVTKPAVKAGTRKRPANSAAAQAMALQDFGVFDCGEDGAVSADTADALVGTIVAIPDTYWGAQYAAKATTACTIMGYAAKHKAVAGKKRGSYVVVTDDDYYAFDASLHIFAKAKRANKGGGKPI